VSSTLTGRWVVAGVSMTKALVNEDYAPILELRDVSKRFVKRLDLAAKLANLVRLMMCWTGRRTRIPAV
jgi:hypothetical protein